MICLIPNCQRPALSFRPCLDPLCFWAYRAREISTRKGNMAYIGKAIPGKHDPLLVAGKGQYAADVSLPDMGWMAVLRSPTAHARITAIDVEAARRLPGVRLVVIGKDILQHTIPIPQTLDPRSLGGNGIDVYCLAIDRVRYVGEAVAAIVADDRYIAAEALDLIQVEYDDLPPVVDAEKALEANAPLVYSEWKTNRILHVHFQGGDVQAAFARAAHTFTGTVRIHRHTGTPMEPRAYVAALDTTLGYLTLWASTQTPHMLRTVIAQTLKMDEEEGRVIQPHVGGAFGIKIATHAEEPLICLLARLTGKPVKWIEERTEHLQVAGHGRDQVHHYEVAFENDGTIIGFKDRAVADNGVVAALCGWGMPFVTAFTLPGAYKIPNCDIDLSIVATNKGALNAYRGFGKESASFVMDRVMDAVARRLQMDRAEVRLKNFIRPDEFPFEQISGMRADSGNYAGALNMALEKAGYVDFPKQQEEARKQGCYLGLEIGFELTPEGGCIPDSFIAAYDSATVRMSPTGTVTVLTGVTSPGGGNETGIAQIVADRLGVVLENVKVLQGDTLVCPYGMGNWSSRSLTVGGGAAFTAAGDIGDVQVRHRGTIGGSTAHFDPAADYPPVCLALDAKFRLTGPKGKRTVAAEDFFIGYMMTAVESQEILTEVRFPVLPTGTGSAYAKHRRIEGGFAIVGIATVVTMRSNLCQHLAIGVSGGGTIPVRLKEVETQYQGKRLDDTAVAAIAEAAYTAAAEPTNELHADAAYKRDMVRVFTRRAVKTAVGRAS